MKKLNLVLVLIFCIFAITGCKEKTDENKLNIVTSFYPMYVATSNIVDGIEDAKLTCLASPSVRMFT